MHHTREDAETVAATGAKDPDTGTTKHIGAAPAESLEIPADAPAAGGKDSDTGKTEHIGAAPAKNLEIQANTYTREVAQWLTSLTSKASERGVFLPTILIEMCPHHHRNPPGDLGFGTLVAQRGLHHDAST